MAGSGPPAAASVLPAFIDAALAQHWPNITLRAPQIEGIAALLAGEDALVVLPTGFGKSLVFQLPAAARKGVTVVLTPLLALCQDQVNDMESRGIAVAKLTYDVDRERRE